jgi:Na+-translocating ferredoxin:NAD+ oxidoreductase subunit B
VQGRVTDRGIKVAYTITEVCVGCSACIEKCPTKSITGEEGKVHSIDSKTCIECGVCGRICPKQAVLDSTGNIAVRVKPTAWPKPFFDKEACISCNMCIQICPVSCLSLSGASEKGLHRHPDMKNPALCIACGFCAEDCPVDAIGMVADLPSKERS